MSGGSEGRVHQTRNGTMKGKIGGGEVEEAKGGSQSRARGIRRQTRNYCSRKVNRRRTNGGERWRRNTNESYMKML